MSIPAVNALNSYTTDYSALQDDLTFLILCQPLLQKINVTQERKFLVDSAIAIDALWLTPRNGGSGTGIIVEDVRLAVSENSDGQLYDLLCGFVVLAERNMAMTPEVGCGMQPEQVEAILAALLSRKVIQPYGQLFPRGTVAGPANDWIDDKSGIYARRISLRILNAWKQPPTCDTLLISDDGAGTVTLTCNSAADGLQIFYTVDGSFPANDQAINPNTQLYAAPFAAASGTIIRAAAHAAFPFNQSAVKQLIVA